MARRVKGAESTIDIRPDDKGLLELAQQWAAGIAEANGEITKARQATEALAGSWKVTASGINASLELADKFLGAVQGAGDLLREAAANNAVDQAFTRRFDNATESLNRLRDAAAGTLSDQALKGIAAEFDRANVSIEDTAKVLNVAARISAETGQDMAEVTEALRDSIIGASDSDLEKFGIIFDLPAEVQKFAKETGLAGDEIDKAVESQVVLRHITGQVADEFARVSLDDNLLTKLDQTAAKFQNIKNEAIGAGQAIVVGLAEDFGLIDRTATNTAGSVEHLNRAIRDELLGALDSQKVGFDDLVAAGKLLTQVDRELVTEQDKARVALYRVTKEAASNKDSFEALDRVLRDVAADSMPMFELAAMSDEEATRALRTATLDLHIAMGTGKAAVDAMNASLQAQAHAAFDAAVAQAELAADQERAAKVLQMKAAAEAEYQRALARSQLLEGRAASAGRRGGGRAGNSEGIARAAAGDVIPSTGIMSGAGGIFGTEPTTGIWGDFSNGEEMGPPPEVFEKMQEAKAQVDSLTTSFQAFGEAFEDSWAERLRNTSITIVDEVTRVADVLSKAEEAGLSSGEAWAKSVPGMVKAAGDIAGAIGASVEVQEIIYGFADAAMAATKFAAYDYVSGAAYTVSSGLHFAAAGIAASKGKGGGAGRSAPAPTRPPQPFTGGQAREGGETHITQHFGGANFVGPSGIREASRAVTSMVDFEHQNGQHSPDFVPAG